MLTVSIILATTLLVLACLFLILLVLIQLPKKEAGMGTAFGGAATDALFGAGSGNMLTKITKYAGTAFFVLVVALSFLKSMEKKQESGEIEKALGSRPGKTAPAATALPTNFLQSAPAEASVPAASTNVAPAPQK